MAPWLKHLLHSVRPGVQIPSTHTKKQSIVPPSVTLTLRMETSEALEFLGQPVLSVSAHRFQWDILSQESKVKRGGEGYPTSIVTHVQVHAHVHTHPHYICTCTHMHTHARENTHTRTVYPGHTERQNQTDRQKPKKPVYRSLPDPGVNNEPF